MPLDWKTVRSEHGRRACQGLAASGKPLRAKENGLFVRFEDKDLPAKQVLSAAYQIANGLPPDAKIKFSSGEATLARLRAMGFAAARRNKETEQAATGATSE